MTGLLSEAGYPITENPEAAAVLVYNSCTVKDPSESKFVNLVQEGLEAGKKVIVTGCVPQGDRGLFKGNNVSVVGVQQIHRIVEVVDEAVKGHTVTFLTRDPDQLPDLEIPKIRKNPLIEIIPISVGCLNNCTYCKTKHARGTLVSYPIEAITKRIQRVCEEGIREIRLTSEDLGAYGIDIDCTIADLLKESLVVLERFPLVMMRLGMTNPPYMLAHLEAVAKTLNHPQVYAFLHIPVQSGSDHVLDVMNRQYTCQEFVDTVDYLKEHVPGITIATDIICGFPGETDEDHQETLDLLRRFEFPIVNISQMYRRPGTPAMRMSPVPSLVRKNRSREVTTLFNSYTTFEEYLEKTLTVHVTELAADGTSLVAHTKEFVQVLLPQFSCQMGDIVQCRIVSSSKFSLKATVTSMVHTHNQPEEVDDVAIYLPTSMSESSPACACGTGECQKIQKSNSCQSIDMTIPEESVLAVARIHLRHYWGAYVLAFSAAAVIALKKKFF
eukprot:TRINITY_DN17260_c0_g1_i1.p1 TRINITY_DN17260_c0_g1~~TRINITY_DN17260_c0_g1_i1.p1  ORF type:complete len:505 (-),score=66.95 TRINITY_DN17260_c0_g1_i1:33-1526(-)